MDISVNLGYYTKNISLEKAAKYVSDAGIKLLDFTPCPGSDKSEWEKASDIFKECGIKVYQCHAPFDRYGTYGDKHKELLDESLDMAQFFGAKYLVVHGDEFDFVNKTYSPSEALNYNYEYFAPIVERAAKSGIYTAFENVFEDDFRGNPRFSSKTEDLLNLIDKFDNEYACCCWYIGHGAVQNKESCDSEIKKLGKIIQCTHVHDNYYNYDSHLVPFFSLMDWQKNMSALKETKCEVLSFELVYGEVPEIAIPSHVKMLTEIGTALNNLIK